MSQLLGTVIAAEITSGDTANTWSLGNLNLFQGGHKTAASLTDRDAITAERRLEGMSCWVVDVQQMFRLIGGIANINWVQDTGSNGNTGIDASARAGVLQVEQIAVTGTNLALLAIQWIGTINSGGVSASVVDPSARAGVKQIEFIADSGTNGANFGIYLASQGTNGVNQVYPIAVAGTTVANLDAIWVGTLTTEVNNTLNWIGTLNTTVAGLSSSGVDSSARAGVKQVEQIADSGTSGANFGIYLASQGTNGVNQILPIAVAGTVVANLDAKWIGTLSTTVALDTTWIGTINTTIAGLSGGGGTNTITTYGTVALPAFVDILQVQVFS